LIKIYEDGRRDSNNEFGYLEAN